MQKGVPEPVVSLRGIDVSCIPRNGLEFIKRYGFYPITHDNTDKAKMTLQRGSYDDQLEILKRNLQSIKVKEEDKGKVENALKELEKIYEENEKINSILAKRN